MPNVTSEAERLRIHLDSLVPPMGPAFLDAVAAIKAVAAGNPDEVIWYEDDERPGAYAHHLVTVWGLESFVEVRRMRANTKTLTEPWWVVEGFVIAAGDYALVTDDKVLTTHGVATLLEPAGKVTPTAFSTML